MWRQFSCSQNWHPDKMRFARYDFQTIPEAFISSGSSVLNDLWVILDWFIWSVLLTLLMYTISMTSILLRQCCQLFAYDSILINHRLMLHQYTSISLLAEALMNAVCLIWISFIHCWQLSFHQTVALISWTWLTSGACWIDTARLWLMPWTMTYPCAVGLFGSYFSSLLRPLHSQFYKTTGFSHEFFIV